MPTENEARARITGIINATARKVISIMKEPSKKIARVIESYANKQQNL